MTLPARMQVLEPFLHWYFGVSPSTEVHQSAWGLRGSLPESGSVAVLLFAIALLVAAAWLYRGEARRLAPLSRLVLIGLRTATLLLLMALLLQVRLVAVHYGRPLLPVLLDTSASMALGDEYSRQERQRLERSLMGIEGNPRLELVRSLLLSENAALLERLSARFELEFYTFDDDASLLHPTDRSPGRSAEDVEELKAALREIEAEGSRTNLSRSLEQILNVHRGSPPVATVVITDGNATEPDQGRLSLVAERARELHSPLFAIGVGSEQRAADVALERVEFDAVAFAGSPLNIDAVIAGSRIAGQKTRVTIHARGGDSPPLDSQQVELPPDDRTVTVSLTTPRLEAGRNEFDVRVEPLPGESDLYNNSQTIRVWARESQLSVLFIERGPRWEFRHLKTALERDQNVDVRTMLLESDVEYVIEDRTALSRLPTSLDELGEYDAVIIGDVAMSELDSRFVALLPRFVGDDGGGLLWLPGEGQRTFDALPADLSLLVPLDVDSGGALPEKGGGRGANSHWILDQTREGQAHPLLSFAGEEEFRLPWEALPAMHGSPQPGRAKEGTLVLLQATRGNGDESAQPMLSAMRYGAGQVLLQSFDETWRWRPLFDGRLYRQYWSQTIRFLTQRRILDQLPALELVTDRDAYMADEPVRVRLITNRPEAVSDEPELRISSEGESRTERLIATREAPHIFETVLQELPSGRYSATLVESPSGDAVSSVEWTVHSLDRERRYRGMNREDLQLAASRSGGKFYHLWEAHRLPEDLPRHHRTARRQLTEIPLWNRWEALLLVAGLMIGEWIFRRRGGLV